MNTEALFLFLILLLGLVLCSFLGGNCNKEGLETISVTLDAGSNDMATNALNNVSTVVPTDVGTNINNGAANVFGDASTSTISNRVDNYNHYSGSGSSTQLQNGMIFTNANGDTVTVITNSNGTQSLQLIQSGQTTPMVLSSPATSSTATSKTFYGPYGNITGTVFSGANGQTAVKINLPNGKSTIFVQPETISNSLSSTQYYGSTGYPVQQSGYSLAYNGPYGGSAGAVTGPNGNTAYYAQGPNGNTVAGINSNPEASYNQYYGPYGGSAGAVTGPYGGSAGAVTGPYGNTAYYAQGSNGNTVAGINSNNDYGNSYYSTMPPGIPANQIPPGQEDLYILKSEIVPPVCPACPVAASCPREEKCPPCPACARCPEPSFECKKVPNYNAINNEDLPNYSDVYGSTYDSNSSSSEYLPQPVVNSFSQF